MTVGHFVNQYIQVGRPPVSGSLTFTAVPSPGLTVVPSTLTFEDNSIAYYAVSAPTTGSYSLGWIVTGQEAAFYSNPQIVSFSFGSSTLYLVLFLNFFFLKKIIYFIIKYKNKIIVTLNNWLL